MHYVIFLRAALSQEILSGDLIYLGNNGQQILAGFPNTLHVGVIVGLSYRVGNLIKLNEYGIDPKTARRLIAKIDKKGADVGPDHLQRWPSPGLRLRPGGGPGTRQ